MLNNLQLHKVLQFPKMWYWKSKILWIIIYIAKNWLSVGIFQILDNVKTWKKMMLVPQASDRRATLSTLRSFEMTPVSSDFKIIYVNDLRY